MGFGDFWLKALHCVVNKILIVYQIEDEAVTSGWSRGSIVSQRAASTDLCGWEELWAVLLAGFLQKEQPLTDAANLWKLVYLKEKLGI